MFQEKGLHIQSVRVTEVWPGWVWRCGEMQGEEGSGWRVQQGRARQGCKSSQWCVHLGLWPWRGNTAVPAVQQVDGNGLCEQSGGLCFPGRWRQEVGGFRDPGKR